MNAVVNDGWCLAWVAALVLAGCGDAPAGPDGPHADTDGELDDGSSGGYEGSSTTGEPDDSPSATGDGEPVCVDYGEPCSQCEMESCGDLYCDCYGNPDCGLLIQCGLDCVAGDLECIGACQATYAGGVTDSVLLADCAAVNCNSECGALALPPPLTTCERCIYNSCGPHMDSCFAIDGCPELLVCIALCAGDTTCQTSCAAQYPSGIEAAALVGNCSLDHCDSPCLTTGDAP